MKKYNFSIIGGDLRSLKLAELLKNDQNEVNIYGFVNANFECNIIEDKNLDDVIRYCDCIIGPLPFSNDDQTINSPFLNKKVSILELLNIISSNQILIAGRINKGVRGICESKNINFMDFFEREDFAVLNAIPTSEGAIQIAMEEMPITLHSSNALILGFGRIGKVLAKMLSGIGSNVYAEARKFSDIAWIKSYGYSPVFIEDLNKHIGEMDVIFNTIPSVVLKEDLLKRVHKDCLIIDLASLPGGIDFNIAKSLGLKVIWALSLPGKVAPITAARFIKETIYNILLEIGGGLDESR